MTDIGKLKELESRATPGPWRVDFYPGGQANCIDCENAKIGGPAKLFDVRGWGYFTGKGHGALGLDGPAGVALQRANAELVTALRNAAPSILARLEAAERVVSAARRYLMDEWESLDLQTISIKMVEQDWPEIQASEIELADALRAYDNQVK